MLPITKSAAGSHGTVKIGELDYASAFFFALQRKKTTFLELPRTLVALFITQWQSVLDKPTKQTFSTDSLTSHGF